MLDLDALLNDYDFKPKHLANAHYLRLELGCGASGFFTMIQELVKTRYASLIERCEPWFELTRAAVGNVFFVEARPIHPDYVEVAVHYGYGAQGTKVRLGTYHTDEVGFLGGRWLGRYNDCYWLSKIYPSEEMLGVDHPWLGQVAPGLNSLEVWKMDEGDLMVTLKQSSRRDMHHISQERYERADFPMLTTIPQIPDHVFKGLYGTYRLHYHVYNYEHAAHRAMMVAMLRKWAT